MASLNESYITVSVDGFKTGSGTMVVTSTAYFEEFESNINGTKHDVDSFQLNVKGPDGISLKTVTEDKTGYIREYSFILRVPGEHTITAFASKSWKYPKEYNGSDIKFYDVHYFDPPDCNYQTFFRLEPRSRVADNDISRGLEARIADPLWMLTRQWQLGEFQAEDSGSPIEVLLNYSTQAIESIKLGSSPPQNLQNQPLEMLVEQEWLQLNWRQRIQIGQRFERSLSALNPTAVSEYRSEYPLEPTEQERARLDKATLRLIDFIAGRAVDGQKLLDAEPIKPLAGISKTQISELTQQLSNWCKAMNIRPKPQKPKAWRTESLDYRFELNPWLYKQFQTNNSAPSLWTRALRPFPFLSRLFEQFWKTLEILLGLAAQGNTPLIAPNYRNGELDWHSFDTKGPLQGTWKQSNTLKLCPTRISVGGVSSRWWAFEDSAIDFGKLDVNKTDLAKLALIEFIVAFSDDWFSVTLPIKSGNLVTIDDFRVTNVFGEQWVHNVGMHRNETSLRPASRLDDDPLRRWQIFALSPFNSGRPAGDAPGFGNLLFIPPVTGKRDESPPLEEVLFLRDEGANMVWAIERTLLNGLGEAVDGASAHREKAERDRPLLVARLEQVLLRLFEQILYADNELERQILRKQVEEIEAQIVRLKGEQPETISAVPRYRLATTVPEHWIPFMPVKPLGSADGVIRLSRARMLRNRDDEWPVAIESLSQLLEIDEEADGHFQLLYLEEATVPRSGLRYQLTTQRVRGIDGETYLWLGRKVLAGRGEGSSGLRFDVLI